MGENDDKTPTGDIFDRDKALTDIDRLRIAVETGDLNHWLTDGGSDLLDAVEDMQDTITRLTRERDNLRVDAEVLSDRFAEVRALADAYIDIVNRTARALGIPEVDEDGAMPSLHDVPERVGRLVAEVERLRPVERTPLERIARAKWAYRYERIDGDHRRVCYLSVEPLWAKITPRTDDSWKDCDWEIGGFGSTLAGKAVSRRAAQCAVRKAFRDALADNEPTDDDATQDPPGWGGGECAGPTGKGCVAGSFLGVSCPSCGRVFGGGEVSDGE